MLYIKTEDGDSSSYHVGAGRITSIHPDWVREVQADGHELEVIKEQFTQLPMHSGLVVNWYDGLAKFIVSNVVL